MHGRRIIQIVKFIVVLAPVNGNISTATGGITLFMGKVSVALNGAFIGTQVRWSVKALSTKVPIQIAQAKHRSVSIILMHQAVITLLTDVVQISTLDVGIGFLLTDRCKVAPVALGFGQTQQTTGVIFAAGFSF